MSELIWILVSAMLVSNFTLALFLGLCPFLGVSSKISTALRMGLSAAGELRPAEGVSVRDGLLVARLLTALPGAFGAWMDEAMRGAAPDAALLAHWRRMLGRLALASEAWLARALADGPDPFATGPATGFVWP